MVIDVLSGELLGFIHDLEFEVRNYQIRFFDVEQKKGCMEKLCPWLFKPRSVRIEVENIESIGNDVILVRTRRKQENRRVR